MPRSRVLTITILACALLAAILFGAAAVLGWVLARPIGVICGIAAITNIALISSPTDGRARRIAMVVGATVLVIAAASGAWGFVSNVPAWLCLMPIGGALLMVPEVLNLMTPVASSSAGTLSEAEEVESLPEPVVQIDGEDDDSPMSADHDRFFSRDHTSTPAPDEATEATEATEAKVEDSPADVESSAAVAEEDVDTGVIPALSDDTDPSIPAWRGSANETTGRHGVIPDEDDDDAADEAAPRRGRRAIVVDWDEDDEEVDNDVSDLPVRGRRAR